MMKINAGIDCVPQLLEELAVDATTLKYEAPKDKKQKTKDPYEGHTWTSALHALVEATAARSAGTAQPYQQAVLDKLSSSKGGRLRFRFQIGPSDDSDSTVDL